MSGAAPAISQDMAEGQDRAGSRNRRRQAPFQRGLRRTLYPLRSQRAGRCAERLAHFCARWPRYIPEGSTIVSPQWSPKDTQVRSPFSKGMWPWRCETNTVEGLFGVVRRDVVGIYRHCGGSISSITWPNSHSASTAARCQRRSFAPPQTAVSCGGAGPCPCWGK